MSNLDLTKQRKGGAAAQVLIWGGVFLLLAGGLLIYPYINSRLVSVPPTPTPDPSPTSLPTFPPLLAITDTPPTSTPPPTPAPASTDTPTYEPTSPPSPPTATTAPALPSRIVIPSLSVDAPVRPVSLETIVIDGQQQAAWQVLDMYAAGWHETSATLGISGNTVLNGHNTTHGEVFRDLYTLKPGDLIIAYSDDTPFTYAVTEILILPEADQPLEVRIDNARHILPTEDERLTLVTCHPYGSLRNRLIVIAQPPEVPEDIEG